MAKLELARRASNSIKAVLVGEWADEIFLGYPAYLIAVAGNSGPIFDAAMRQTTRPGLDLATARGIDTSFWQSRLGYVPNQVRQTYTVVEEAINLLADSLARSLNPDKRLEEFMHESGAMLSIRPVAREQLAGAILTMPNYLFSYLGGKIEMASGLEGRYPFLDRELVDYAISLDPMILLAGNLEKGLLRSMAEAILPPSILHRPKHGFSARILPRGMVELFLQEKIPGATRSETETVGIFDAGRVFDLFLTLNAETWFRDEGRVAAERVAVFVLSLRSLYAQFLAPATRKFTIGPS